ncbi:aminotransferase class V-fold PLP-dependent enzyme [Aquabacterium sp. J223]|uniref:aminotransferase class V-fold PLP-dependent enzyme n=1 Tax=Aquabacterium sp. J223 TaxID=2898431 RepID=UPI0021ADF1CD|nr:aminotransferase class V-fold PLP-dependent enzyme [Aquabacterium sp. J223]UUX94766.1 aminotransferase class V-fold PLP-dependent enzyme [Aquabacterium sp. J223]
MPGLLPQVDPDGLLEYSVVYTDRALNHMSAKFQHVMRDIAATLKEVYRGQAAVVMPGSGTFGMEAVARQFATGQRVLVLRNGWFSYRWSQIFEMGRIPSAETVLKAARIADGPQAPWAPAPIDRVVETIRREKPALVFAPHVETAAGIVLPDDYLRAVGQAVRESGGLFVLDCIASGALWVDLQACQVDVLVSAPQKGWSGSPGSAFVVLGDRALERLPATTSTSFAADLKRWHQIMQTYEGGAHAYHTTMPTDALTRVRDVMAETRAWGFETARQAQLDLGRKVRTLLAQRGFASVAAPGFEAAGVVVSYTDDPDIANARKFAAQGLQTAAGVPLQCDEGPDFRTWRIGLFGLDKWRDVEGAVGRLAQALERLR